MLSQVLQGTGTSSGFTGLWLFLGHVEPRLHVCWDGEYWVSCTFANFIFYFYIVISDSFCVWWLYSLVDIPQGTFLLWPWQPRSARQNRQGNLIVWLNFIMLVAFSLVKNICLTIDSGPWNRWIECISEQVSVRTWCPTRGTCWEVSRRNI